MKSVTWAISPNAPALERQKCCSYDREVLHVKSDSCLIHVFFFQHLPVSENQRDFHKTMRELGSIKKAHFFQAFWKNIFSQSP